MTKKEKLSTSQDVAKLAGVSQSAVSRCFNKGGSISNRLRLRVLEAAKKLKYKPRAINFESNDIQDSKLVGVILPYITNRYYPEVLTELHEILRQNDFRVLLITTDDGETVNDKLIQPYLKDKLIAIISAAKPTDAFVNSCNNQNIQIIAFNRNWNIPTTSSVSCDQKNGGETIAQYFYKQKHQHIACINGYKNSFISQQRTGGFLNKLKLLKIQNIVTEQGFFTYEGGRDAAQKILKKNKKITAIFCANDIMAFGCIDYIKYKTSLNIPKQIEIIGFDDVSAAEWQTYSLSTIRQPLRQMAKLSIQLILDNINDNQFENTHHLIQGKFIKRLTSR